MSVTPELEAVARALFNFDSYQGYNQETLDHRWMLRSSSYIRRARLALRAIRDLSEPASAAAYAALDRYDIASPGACTVTFAHQAIIDHILGETP